VVSLLYIFWMMVILFAIIGAMRGWAREMMVSFAVVLAVFVLTVVEKYIPFVRDSVKGPTLFWVRTIFLLGLVFFGYQTPNIPKLAATNRFARERLQDTLLGVFLGAINGYLIFGTLWFFLNDAGYPFQAVITAPDKATAAGQAALQLVKILPPNWLAGTPAIYFAVALCFVFVLVVFI
jgi:uncharacterized membrane protein required for colicin V production